MKKLNYLLSTPGKFSYINVAKALIKKNQLVKIVSGWPWFKLKNENIPKNFVKSSSLINLLNFFLEQKISFTYFYDYLNKLNNINIDRITSKYVDKADVLLSMSGTGLNSGMSIVKEGKIYICERTSAHIIFQQEIISEEYKELNQPKFEIYKWFIDRELQEYEKSDIILVPSLFVKKSFEKYYTKKVHVINLGVNLKNYFPIHTINKDNKFFNILWVGSLSIRKGLHYLIEAFKKFKHPKKRLHLVGVNYRDKNFFSNQLKDDNIFVYGYVEHYKLIEIMNKSDVFVLPSLEDGFGVAVLQVLATGCPVIVSENTGAADVIREHKCGFVVPIRNSQIIADKLTLLSDDRLLLKEFSNNALKISTKYSWDDYVNKLDQLVTQFKKNRS